MGSAKKLTFGYEYEEEAKKIMSDVPTYDRQHKTLLSITYAQLASVEVLRQIASTLVDIEIAIRDLTKTLSEKKQERGGTINYD